MYGGLSAGTARLFGLQEDGPVSKKIVTSQGRTTEIKTHIGFSRSTRNRGEGWLRGIS